MGVKNQRFVFFVLYINFIFKQVLCLHFRGGLWGIKEQETCKDLGVENNNKTRQGGSPMPHKNILLE